MPRVLIVFAALICGFCVIPTASARTNLNRSELSLLRVVNSTRASYHLAPLRVDTALTRAARSHTSDMIRANVFTHGSFSTRMHSFHVRGPAMGENLAWGSGPYGSPQSIVRMWLDSPPHRANLLRPGFRRIGLGVTVSSFQGETGATVVTADFAGR